MEFPHDDLPILASRHYSTAITWYIDATNGPWKSWNRKHTTVLQISKFTHRVKRGLVPLRVLRYYAEKQKWQRTYQNKMVPFITGWKSIHLTPIKKKKIKNILVTFKILHDRPPLCIYRSPHPKGELSNYSGCFVPSWAVILQTSCIFIRSQICKYPDSPPASTIWPSHTAHLKNHNNPW